MKKYISHAYLSLVITWCTFAVQAEDIEVYRGQSVGIRPNVMFVMDVSGSMGYWEVEQDPEYNPDEAYNDSSYKKFNPNLYYYSNYYSGGNLSSYSVSNLLERPANPNSMVCNGGKNSIEKHGFLTGTFKRWHPSKQRWEPRGNDYNNTTPKGGNNVNALIECKADEGDHPSGKYVNVLTNTKNQYLSYVPYNYNYYWQRNFRYIYSGHYLNYKLYIQATDDERIQSRMQISRNAAKTVVNTTTGIRLGMARFNSSGSSGGFIDIATEDIEDVRQSFTNKIDTYLPWGGTPLSETYYETALYLNGKQRKFGGSGYSRRHKAGTELVRDSNGFINYYNNDHSTYWQYTPSVANSYQSGSRYKSPITSACQSTSSIILFTDGEPSSDDEANQNIRNLIKNINFPSSQPPLSKNCGGHGGCADELAYYLANYDQRPDLPGKQVIRTFVIGGFFDDTGTSSAVDRMKSIAKHGDGEYFAANSYEKIVKSLQKSLQTASDTPVTFVAPAVAANAYNSLEHLDELYYAMFSPEAGNSWQGNLKSYRLGVDGVVLDSLGESAVNADGTFKAESRSYWTDENIRDGDDVVVGGAASLLSKEHNIFTHLSTNKGELKTTLSTDNISKELLGLESSASAQKHANLIDWMNRKSNDGANDTRREMEDPLHSRPLIVTYKSGIDQDGNITQEGVVFIGTNSGYLHAFNADKNNYKEYFSFIPKELLKNANEYVEGENQENKTYGIDGPISYWHADKNRDGIVDSNEKIYLFFGLRRGGRQYYALDISNPKKPKYMWQVNGGTGDFDKLGQTWAPMTLAKVPWKGSTKVVLLFGGGYDASEDNRTARAPHDMGNAIYMIDPETGKLLWSASKSGSQKNDPDMTSAITSEISTIDFDGDQITDYFYASDVGGRIWRFDINENTQTANDFISGSGVIFDANGDSNAPYQRFFYAPSISYFADKDKTGRIIDRYLTLSIGTGYRAHPLQSGTQDSFYILKDQNIEIAPQKYTKMKPSNFSFIPKTTPLEKSISTPGWKYDLRVSEKVLSKSLTANGNIYFTTFSPTISAPNPGACSADIGTGSAYIISFKPDGFYKLDMPGPMIEEPPSSGQPGIPPQPIKVKLPADGDDDPDFCEENPSHEKCNIRDCEQATSVILSGTSSIGGSSDSCEFINKEYWYEF